MKLQKTLSVSLSALLLLGAAAFPAKAVGDSTVEQVDAMIQGLGGQTDADGIPTVIAPAPDALYSIVIDGERISGKAAVAVPLRAVAEKLGFAVTWRDGVITVDDGQTRCTITVGVDRYQTENSAPDVPGISAPVSLGMAPYVVDGVSYVPVALFDQLLGMEGIVSLENGAVVIDTHRREAFAAPASPYIPCADMDEAAKLAGFSMTVPGTPDRIEAWAGEMLQVFYDGEQATLCIRKAPGREDISGDYNVYPQVETVDGITLKGENGSVRLALWTADGYTYAVSLAQGATRREVLALVHEIG